MGIVAKLKKFRSKKGKQKKKKKPEEEMTFLEHLEELRWHIMRSLAAIVAVGVLIFIYRVEVIEGVLLAPLDGNFPMHKFICWFKQDVLGDLTATCLDKINVDIQIISPYEGFLKALTIAFVGGFVVAFPYVLWEVWRFIKPGLHPHERSGLRGNVAIMSLLFFMGVSFGYFVITPFSVQFLANFKLTSGVEEVQAPPPSEVPSEVPREVLEDGTITFNGRRDSTGNVELDGRFRFPGQDSLGSIRLRGKMPVEGEIELEGTIRMAAVPEKAPEPGDPGAVVMKDGTVIENNWRIGNVIGLITQIVLAGGILFELPIMVYYLTKIGVLSPEFMRTYRRHAIVVLLIISAIITPPDPLSQILLFVPLMVLYEVSLQICKRVYKREQAKLYEPLPKEEEPKKDNS